MIISNYEYGICLLPKDCMAYKDGYRYGAYRHNREKNGETKITAFLKTLEDVSVFLSENMEYINPDTETIDISGKTDEK